MKPCPDCQAEAQAHSTPVSGGSGAFWRVECGNPDCKTQPVTAWMATSTGAIWAWDAGEVERGDH